MNYPILRDVSVDRVRELFDYKDGALIRKGKAGRRWAAGREVGYKTPKGYIQTQVDGKLYLLHRLIYLWHYGYMPENAIDHIDQDCENNRIENLREVSYVCNSRNSKQKPSSSGIKGVHWSKTRKKWCVQIVVANVAHHLGITKCLLEAASLRFAAEQCLGWADCERNSPACLYVKENIGVASR